MDKGGRAAADQTTGLKRSKGSFKAIFGNSPATSSSSDEEGHANRPLYNPQHDNPDAAVTMRHSSSASAIIDLTGGMADWRNSVQKPLTYKMGNSTIRFQRPLVAAMAVIFMALLVLLYVAASGRRRNISAIHDDHSHFSDLQHPFGGPSADRLKYNSTYPLSQPTITEKGMRFRIAVIADLDEASKVEGKKDSWRSYLKRGHLTYGDNGSVDIAWDADPPTELRSAMSSGGRGMELSELIVFDGKLFTVDDRTGIIYQVDKDRVVPWHILSDGAGKETKGFKSKYIEQKNGSRNT